MSFSKGLAAALLAAPLAFSGAALAEPTDEDYEEATTFVLGNAVFVMLHEFGHALVSELGLPVLGREEDAVDGLATVLLLPEEPTPETDQILIDAMDGWFMTDDMMAATDAELALWDEHGLDAQRGYQIACLALGSDPEGFADLAESVGLPPDRQETCPDDWDRTQGAWLSVLEPHVLDEDEPPPAISVILEEAPEDLRPFRDLLEQTDILSDLAQGPMAAFRLPRPITLAAASCGEPNAFWDAETARITLCYELLAFHNALIFDDIENRSP